MALKRDKFLLFYSFLQTGLCSSHKILLCKNKTISKLFSFVFMNFCHIQNVYAFSSGCRRTLIKRMYCKSFILYTKNSFSFCNGIIQYNLIFKWNLNLSSSLWRNWMNSGLFLFCFMYFVFFMVEGIAETFMS